MKTKGHSTSDNKNKAKTSTNIQTQLEKDQDIELTMDEIDGQKEAKKTTSKAVSEKEVQAGTERINPDQGSMDSRG